MLDLIFGTDSMLILTVYLYHKSVLYYSFLYYFFLDDFHFRELSKASIPFCSFEVPDE